MRISDWSSDVCSSDLEDWRKRTGKPHAINYFEVSPDLRFVAVGISESGAEIGSLHLFDLSTAKPVEAPHTRLWFGFDWLPDSRGLRYPLINDLTDGPPAADLPLHNQY